MMVFSPFSSRRMYCKSGRLNEAYLRFLWMHRKIDPPGSDVNLTDEEFKSVVETMVRLLVMHRSSGADNHLVVPARLPEYGDERILNPGNISDIVARVECSFGQVYPPPGIVGRFLAWSTQEVVKYGECWQHGAFFDYKFRGARYKVFLYECEDRELHEDGTVTHYAGLNVCVQGSQDMAGEVLDAVRASLEQLVADPTRGYPSLVPLMSFGEAVEIRSTELADLRSVLDNVSIAVDRLEEVVRKLGGVMKQLLEQGLLCMSDEQDEYPRLVILHPEEESEEDGAPKQIQRKRWDRWAKAWDSLSLPDISLHHKFRHRFLCEHDLSEVPCGPNGRGYPVNYPKEWARRCLPLMQVTDLPVFL